MTVLAIDYILTASYYKLPNDGESTILLAIIESRVSSSSYGMRSLAISNLLLSRGISTRTFYKFQGEELTSAKALICQVPQLLGLRSFIDLIKTDVI